jgi:hypothetical protein
VRFFIAAIHIRNESSFVRIADEFTEYVAVRQVHSHFIRRRVHDTDGVGIGAVFVQQREDVGYTHSAEGYIHRVNQSARIIVNLAVQNRGIGAGIRIKLVVVLGCSDGIVVQ